MQKNLLPLGLILGAYGIYVYQKSRAGASLQIQTSKVSNFNVKSGSLNFDLELGFINNSSENLTINGTGSFIYLNGQSIASLQTNKQITIARYSPTPVTIPVSIPLFSLVGIGSAVQDFIVDGKPMKLLFKGTARTLGLTIPLQDTFTITNPLKQAK